MYVNLNHALGLILAHVPMPLITLMLVGAVYASQLVDGIRDMLSKPKMMKNSIWNIHFHNLKTDN